MIPVNWKRNRRSCDRRPGKRPRLPSFGVLFVSSAAAFLAFAACDDDPFAVRWVVNPDTVKLYALSRPEPNLVSGYDFFPRRPVRIEAPTTGDDWDLAVDVRDGQFVWLPPGSLGIPSDAAVAVLEGETFESATEAPEDTAAYVMDAPIPIVLGTIYVVRTRQHPGFFGTLCNYYGKIEPLAADFRSGSVYFQFDVSQACNNLDLIPPD